MRILLSMQAWVPGIKVSLLPTHLVVRETINFMAANGLESRYSGDNFHLDEAGDAATGLSHFMNAWLGTQRSVADPGNSAVLADMKERACYWLTNWGPCQMGGAITVLPHGDATPIVTPAEPPFITRLAAPSMASGPAINAPSLAVGQTVTVTPFTWTGNPPPTIERRWQHRPSGGSWTTITGETLVIPTGIIGSDIRAQEQASNTVGTSTWQSSNARWPVTAAAPTGPTRIFEITEDPYAGPTLTGTLPAASGGYRTFTTGPTPALTAALDVTNQVHIVAAIRVRNQTEHDIHLISSHSAGNPVGPAHVLLMANCYANQFMGVVDETVDVGTVRAAVDGVGRAIAVADAAITS